MVRGFWTLLVVFVVALLGSLALERNLQDHYVLELYLLMVAVLMCIITLFGVINAAGWSWPFATVLSSLFAFNALVVYLATYQSRITFALVLLVSFGGMALGFWHSTDSAGDPLETLPQMEFRAAKRRKK